MPCQAGDEGGSRGRVAKRCHYRVSGPPRFIDTLLAPNLVLDFSTGANAGSLLILVITPSGTATVGPFSLPANYCTPIQTGYVPTNPPVVVVGGIIYGGGGPTVLDFEPVP